MKKLLCMLALLGLSFSSFGAAGIKISEYPNTNTLTTTNLFLIAIKGSTNMNISWGQLRYLILSDSTNIAVAYATDGTNFAIANTNINLMNITNAYVGQMFITSGTITNATNSSLTVSGIITSTNLTAQIANPTHTSLATAADQTISLNSDTTVSITNAVAGAVNVWITNAVDRKWFVLRCVADGTARTLSFTNASGLTLNVVNTNNFSVVTLPQVPVTANKIATIVGRVWVSAGTTNVDLFGSVQQ